MRLAKSCSILYILVIYMDTTAWALKCHNCHYIPGGNDSILIGDSSCFEPDWSHIVTCPDDDGSSKSVWGSSGETKAITMAATACGNATGVFNNQTLLIRGCATPASKDDVGKCGLLGYKWRVGSYEVFTGMSTCLCDSDKCNAGMTTRGTFIVMAVVVMTMGFGRKIVQDL